jgi:hypothetical protein
LTDFLAFLGVLSYSSCLTYFCKAFIIKAFVVSLRPDKTLFLMVYELIGEETLTGVLTSIDAVSRVDGS